MTLSNETPTPLEVVCVGGGPAGLLLGILLHTAGTGRVTVFERNRADDTFGFGVVFSDETLANLHDADPLVFDRIEQEMAYWTTMDVVHGERTLQSGGHGYAALSRKRLLLLLSERAREVGVDIRYETNIESIGDALAAVPGADLVVGADGLNSMVRTEIEDQFEPDLTPGDATYIWFATEKRFEQFTFLFAETEWGLFQAHVYPFSDMQSTFIVETRPEVWRAAGLTREGLEPLSIGETDERSKAFCEQIFAQHLDGNTLVGNNSQWLTFRTVRNGSWRARLGSRDVVLLGDAAHTAHFSIGSGTKLALEDSMALAEEIAAGHGSMEKALAAYEENRRPPAESLQRAAITSQRWFEHPERYIDLPSEQFTFQLLTRSQRITYDNLFMRDDEFASKTLGWFHDSVSESLRPEDPTTPPMFYPYEMRGLRLPNRIAVSPMAQYCAVDGLPTDWHLVHLGSRAVGGAGLIMTEMTCVSPEGRITPGCPGLWNDEQAESWRRVTDFVHQNSGAAIGLQLGHAGRKGSTRVAWEGMDRPLDSDNWELLAPSALPYYDVNVVPQEMTTGDFDEVLSQFVDAANRAVDAGFDLLEVHAAHGYLLSSFLSPITNHRTDGFGGSLENRMRYPLTVVEALRDVWPDDRPMSVRISATDWVEGGFDGNDAIEFSARLHEKGVDIIDVSTGQVDPSEDPEFGRLYQTPFSDRIRNELKIPTMTVGAVSSIDDVNTIILAGRADLCMMARPHLVDPYWTLNAGIDQGYTAHEWPPQYLSGRTARRREQNPIALIER